MITKFRFYQLGLSIFICSTLCTPCSAQAFRAGFNQAWFHDNYAAQYLDGVYDQAEVERIFKLARSSGAPLIRLWFFESLNFPQLVWESEKVRGIRPDFIKNVIRMLEVARANGVRVYMTFLDAQVYRPNEQKPEERARFKYLLTEEGSNDLIRFALHPFLTAIEAAGLSAEIERIDLMNEGDAAVFRFGFKNGWNDAGRFLCQWKSAIREHAGFLKTPVSFSIRLAKILPLPKGIFKNEGPMACADFYDFHSYNNQGEIHFCNRVARYSSAGGKETILGEFGQSYFYKEYDDELQVKLTGNYLARAEACGFSTALAWRLSDIRPGHNREARYSFETETGTRPAYRLIQDRNRKP